MNVNVSDNKMQMDIKEIEAYLPHRYPFLFVDRVTSVEAGKNIRGFKNVSINESYFQGHFPGEPIFPGVLMLEALAQISGILGFVTTGTRPNDDRIHYFAGSDKVRFKRPVVPGDQLLLEADFKSARHNIWKFDCRALVGDQLVCSAEIMTAEKER